MKPHALDRLCRPLLRLFPAGFRQRHATDLVQLYRDLYWAPGRFAALRFLVRVAADALVCGVAARWDALTEPAPAFARRHTQGEPMSTFLSDLRLTARSLSRRPGFTLAVVVTLALGLGANAGIFSVVNAVLLRPLPYPEPDRIVRFQGLRQGELSGPISYPNFVDWRDQATTLTATAAYDEWQPNLTGEGHPERLDAARVTSNFLRCSVSTQPPDASA